MNSPERFTAEHYDYTNRAWIGPDGRYLPCAHPESMNCKCFGKVHTGEPALSYACGHSFLTTESPRYFDEACADCHKRNWGAQ